MEGVLGEHGGWHRSGRASSSPKREKAERRSTAPAPQLRSCTMSFLRHGGEKKEERAADGEKMEEREGDGGWGLKKEETEGGMGS